MRLFRAVERGIKQLLHHIRSRKPCYNLESVNGLQLGGFCRCAEYLLSVHSLSSPPSSNKQGFEEAQAHTHVERAISRLAGPDVKVGDLVWQIITISSER